jgi:hypothetical protein
MAIDMASVYAAKYRKNPNALRAAVMGQSPDASLDSYTALNALRLIKEADMMAMAGQAQQPTSAPSILAQNFAPPAPPQGMAGVIPMGAPAGQMPQRAPMPQPTMQAASGGLAGMYTPEEDFAEGGIVAFQEGGLNAVAASDDATLRMNGEGETDDGTDAGKGSATEQLNAILLNQIASMQKRKVKTTSPEDIKKLRAEFLAKEIKNSGPDIYEAEIARGAQEDADRAKRRNTGEAMALLTAAGKVLKGRNLAEGASEALPAYAGAISEVDRADQAIKNANAKMQFALKDAQRKERAGNNRAADAAMENYRKFEQDQNKAEFDKENAIATLAARGITGNRTTGKGAGGAQPSAFTVLFNAKQALSADPKNPQLQAAVKNAEQAAALTKTSYSTGEIGAVNAATRLAPVQVNIDTKVNEGLRKYAETSAAGAKFRQANRAGNTEEAKRLLKAEEARLREVFQASETAAGNAPAPTPSATKPKVIKLD